MSGKMISPNFRERLMIAVTAVYGCRYCSYFHTKVALMNGMNKEEIEGLLKGLIDICPDKEVTAILYAQHWVEKNTIPDLDVKQKLLEAYGKRLCEQIELILRIINFGNLLGNTWEFFLYKISFGFLGK
jgi:AhpD family alkylhydroperoxidase